MLAPVAKAGLKRPSKRPRIGDFCPAPRRFKDVGVSKTLVGGVEHAFGMGEPVAELPIPELVENRRRSIAMLPPEAPALNRDEALEVLRQLGDALREVRELRRRLGS
jgi:hypothetical protein